jgi:hypothetical protein
MSGPMAAGFGIEAAVLISAQSILQGAAEIAAGMDEAERAAEERRQQRRTERRQMRAAQAAGQIQQQQDAKARDQLTRLTQLAKVVDPAGAVDLDARMTALLASGVSLQEELAAFLAHAKEAAAQNRVSQRQTLVAHVLGRLELDVALTVPDTLLALAQQVVAAPSDERAEALATELRLQVQRHNEALTQAAEQKKLQEAAAIVLEQSLKDLGYAVEDIEATLFVEGGIAHFQRPEWGDYYIRLRIDPKRGAMNFNVVRAGTAGEDRRHEDMLAEERWCSEFPKLFETLKARGIPINVTRLLQAGEAPVQVVDAASLPERATNERRHEPLKARSIE